MKVFIAVASKPHLNCFCLPIYEDSMISVLIESSSSSLVNMLCNYMGSVPAAMIYHGI